MKRLYSYIQHSFTARLSFWVTGIVIGVFVVTLMIMFRFTINVVRDKSLGSYMQSVIMEEFKHLQVFSILIVAVALLLLLIACWKLIDMFLAPLDKLAEDVKALSWRDGFEETIKDEGRKDEIGGLQSSFSTMQHMLANYLGEIRQKTEALRQRQKELETAYERAKEDQRVKEAFLSNITRQIAQPVNSINLLTNSICSDYKILSEQEMGRIRQVIMAYTNDITSLIDETLISSQQVANPEEQKPVNP